ncbi:MAG: carbohydrate ABC transporter permease [Actinobacteria bacterium]|nr:carbohydrate ABC transporter permease [Actinomycetota bacterium]
MNIYRSRIAFRKVVVYLILIIMAFSSLFPIAWMLIASFKTRAETLAFPPTFNFEMQTIIENYKATLFSKYGGFWRLLLNSVAVSFLSTIFALFLGTLAAYGFARFKFRGKKNLAFWILSTRFLPAMAIVIPVFLTMKYIHLIDNYFGLIIPYIAMSLPFIIWLMIGFFQEIPSELEEAAMVDGASRIGAFLRISIPLAVPGLIAASIFTVIICWNEFLIALFVTSTYKSKTAPVAASGLLAAQRAIEWNTMATVGIVTIIPILIFSIFIQKYLVRGLTLGAIK